MLVEAAIILLLLKSRTYRAFPVFTLYVCWDLCSDAFLFYFARDLNPKTYFRVYVGQLILDSAMIFALLVEVAWSVLRPIRNSLPKYSWIGIAVLIGIGALILWPIAGFTVPDHVSNTHMTSLGRDLFLLQQTPALLRVVFFLALAAFSQVLSIGWRDRELQIATGLGFYSIVSFAVTMAHTHQLSGTHAYHWLDRAGSISYAAALVYWVFAFATKPAERREFTPQMQSMLLAVAGAARSTRVELAGSGSDKPRP